MSMSVKVILSSLISLILFTILFFAIRLGLNYIPTYYLWNNLKSVVSIYHINLTIVDMIYFAFGLVVTTHGIVNLFLITEENHKGQNMETRKPEQLITTGFYSKARHPMYSTFIIINLGIFLTSRTLWGILIVVLVSTIQLINVNFEEKNQLLKIFGENYENYMKEVKNKMMLPPYKIYIVVGIILTIGGLSANLFH